MVMMEHSALGLKMNGSGPPLLDDLWMIVRGETESARVKIRIRERIEPFFILNVPDPHRGGFYLTIEESNPRILLVGTLDMCNVDMASVRPFDSNHNASGAPVTMSAIAQEAAQSRVRLKRKMAEADRLACLAEIARQKEIEEFEAKRRVTAW